MSADILHFVAMSEAPNRIRELRLAVKPKKLSQEALGNLVGTSKMTISDLEGGKMSLTQDYMRRIARALGVMPADLLPPRDNPDGLTTEERRFLAQLRAASPDKREQILKVADVIAPYHGAEEDQDRLYPRKTA